MKFHAKVGRAILIGLGIIVIAAVYSWYNRDTSVYSPRFTEDAFRQIKVGMSEESVYEVLGPPLLKMEMRSPESWSYGDVLVKRSWWITVADLPDEAESVEFDRAGYVIAVSGKRLRERVGIGMTRKEVLALLGEPKRIYPQESKILHYSKPSDSGVYRARIISVDEVGLVSNITTYDLHD